MKIILKIALALGMALGLAGGASAQEYTSGEITKIDTAQKKLTIKHGELTNLDMPAMTMVPRSSVAPATPSCAAV